MFSKKILFPVAAIAMASFVACGDDSSSSPSSKEAPASIKDFSDIGDYECSATVNKCAKVYLEDMKDTMQCDGVQTWQTMLLGKPVKGCEEATPAAETPADPAAETPADPAAETPADPAAETPADPAAETPADPAAETPADPAAETPADPAAETPADPAAETPADPAAETPADPAAETPTAGGPTCYMASDVPGMASCLPITEEECTAFSGEWVEACPVN